MRVSDLMSREPLTCAPGDDLGHAAMLMWRGDCGILPVVEDGRVVGLVTDRDICMGLALAGARPRDRQVGEVMSRAVAACAPDDALESALATMATHRVRRLPVLAEGRLAGMLSLHDVVLQCPTRGKPSPSEVLATLAAICLPHRGTAAAPVGVAKPAAPRSKPGKPAVESAKPAVKGAKPAAKPRQPKPKPAAS